MCTQGRVNIRRFAACKELIVAYKDGVAGKTARELQYQQVILSGPIESHVRQLPGTSSSSENQEIFMKTSGLTYPVLPSRLQEHS